MVAIAGVAHVLEQIAQRGIVDHGAALGARKHEVGCRIAKRRISPSSSMAGSLNGTTCGLPILVSGIVQICAGHIDVRPLHRHRVLLAATADVGDAHGRQHDEFERPGLDAVLLAQFREEARGLAVRQ